MDRGSGCRDMEGNHCARGRDPARAGRDANVNACGSGHTYRSARRASHGAGCGCAPGRRCLRETWPGARRSKLESLHGGTATLFGITNMNDPHTPYPAQSTRDSIRQAAVDRSAFGGFDSERPRESGRMVSAGPLGFTVAGFSAFRRELLR
jgi:hypothetical protein